MRGLQTGLKPQGSTGFEPGWVSIGSKPVRFGSVSVSNWFRGCTSSSNYLTNRIDPVSTTLTL
ncbi:hypothetical protein HanPSC8_Chr03g0084371 [Helianthus annuus]|nr:hypothetical protein HanPSC8_Chr03g0084371 [Helianthus annuus]